VGTAKYIYNPTATRMKPFDALLSRSSLGIFLFKVHQRTNIVQPLMHTCRDPASYQVRYGIIPLRPLSTTTKGDKPVKNPYSNGRPYSDGPFLHTRKPQSTSQTQWTGVTTQSICHPTSQRRLRLWACKADGQFAIAL
jgi:hypothetical protein